MSNGGLRLIAIFITASLVLLGIFQFAQQRAEQVSLPRYCDAPSEHLALISKILTEERPAGDDNRRPYIVAAKLIYLVPRNAEEGLNAYLERLRQRISETCR